MELVADNDALSLSKGYKQTEVGLIPSDWEVKTIGEISKLKNGYAFSSEYFSKTGPIVITPGNFKLEGGLKFNDKNTIRFSGYISKEMQFKNGDLLIVMTDLTPDCNLLGKPGIVDSDEIILHNQRIGKITVTNNQVNQDYLYWFFVSDLFSKRMKETATGSTVRHTSVGSINNSIIAIPTKTEQTAIATALSDADALISSLEKLIAKKRNIKQGAMQKLLQPKEGWEVKKLGEIAEIYQPQTISQDVFVEDGYLVYGANGVIGKFHLFNHETWQTTITCRGSTCGTVNRTIDKSWITGNAMVMNIDENRNIDKLFFYYILTKQDFSQCITGSGQPQIVRSPLFDFTISIPKSKEKQKEIAFILSDMDAEINALETKLEKYRKVKLGMMQVLLTGKIRLI